MRFNGVRTDLMLQNSEVVSVTDPEMHNRTKNNLTLRSIQVRGRGQIAAVEGTPVGSDVIRP